MGAVTSGSARARPLPHTCRSRRQSCIVPLCAAAVALTFSATLPAGNRTLLVEQGTDMSVTASRDGVIVTDIAGRLWRLPETGGEATAITPPSDLSLRPALAPDGRTLAFQSLRDGYFQILVTDLEEGETRQVTSGYSHHVSPVWSADGRRLAMASDRSGDFGIWELEIDTLAMRQLTFEPGDERDPAWGGPDGSILVYISDLGDRSLLVLRAPSQAPRTLASSDRRLHAPAWRPDGSVITYVAATGQGPRLHMVILSEPPVIKVLAPGEMAFPAPVAWKDRNHLLYTADGGIRMREFGVPQTKAVAFTATIELSPTGVAPSRRLPEFREPQPISSFSGLTVLPDGRLIAAALGNILELGAEGQLLRTITADDFINREPAVTSDGGRLAFTSDRGGSTQIWIMDVATGDLQQLTDGPGAAVHPAWSHDGSRLAYVDKPASGAQRPRLMVYSMSSASSIELSHEISAEAQPAWSPDGTRLGVVERSGGSAQLLLFATDGSRARRRATLPGATVGAGPVQLQWSPDGQRLLLASSAGIHTLPILDHGLPGADFTTISDQPAQAARWLPDGKSVVFTTGGRIGLTSAGAEPRQYPVALSWQPASSDGRTIVRAGKVFDGESTTYLYNQDVIVEDGRIVAVQPWSPDLPARGERLIDARTKVVLPGLIDTAVELGAAGERPGRALLAWGITTVQALTAPTTDLRELAELWFARRAGPRLLQSPQACAAAEAPTLPNGSGAVIQGALRICAGDVQRVATTAAAARDFGVPVWSDDWLTAASGLVDAILPPTAWGAQQMLPGLARSGALYQDAVDVIIHSGVAQVSGLAASSLPLLADGPSDLLHSPQYLALYTSDERDSHARSWRETLSRDGARRRHWLRDRQRLLRQLASGGGRIVAGSGVAEVAAGIGLHAEMRWLVQGGFQPVEALRMATSAAARSIGLQEEIGTLAPGHAADFLIVDGDPLANIGDLARIETVIIGGEIRQLKNLLRKQDRASEKFTANKAVPLAKPAREP